METTTAELKSDSSLDITWKVKLTGRILNDGWGDFAVANNLQIGNVVLVRYEGGMVFHVSDLGPSFSQIRDIKPPRQNIDDDDDGKCSSASEKKTNNLIEEDVNLCDRLLFLLKQQVDFCLERIREQMILNPYNSGIL